MRARKAFVVGGGLAGLSAAYDLRKGGWEVTVLEAGACPGGRAATIRHGAYTIDTGATQLSSGYTEYLRLCAELGLADQIVPCSNRVGIVRDGKIHEIDGDATWSGPLSPVISWGSKFRMARTLLDARRLRPRLNYLELADSYRDDDESVADYSRRRLNPELFDYIVSPLLRGNFLRRPDEASKLDWFAILRSFAGQKMLTMRGGIHRLPMQLAAQLDVRLQARVTSLVSMGGTVSLRWHEQGEERSGEADACVVATRLPEAMAISADFAVAAAPLRERLSYSPGTLVHLGYACKTRSSVLGLFVSPREHAQIALIWIEHNKSADAAPDGHGLITCYFDAAAGSHMLTDDALVAAAADYVERLFPELQHQREMALVTRWPLAIPFPRPGAYAAVHALREGLDLQAAVQYAGDYFTCIGQNSAIHHGRQAAARLLRSPH